MEVLVILERKATDRKVGIYFPENLPLLDLELLLSIPEGEDEAGDGVLTGVAEVPVVDEEELEEVGGQLKVTLVLEEEDGGGEEVGVGDTGAREGNVDDVDADVEDADVEVADGSVDGADVEDADVEDAEAG